MGLSTGAGSASELSATRAVLSLGRLLIGGVMRCSGRGAARSAAVRLAERQGYGDCGQVCTG
jgi:hypothetical protein